MSNLTEAGYYATYWQHIVTAMRGVSGAHFKFLWCGVTEATSGWSLTDAYPGSAYVDYIGVDVYDWSVPGNSNPTPAQRWANVYNASPYNGIAEWQSLATSYGKPLTFPEWGLWTTANGGGGDDPYFIDTMSAYIQNASNGIYFASYYDVSPLKLLPTNAYATAYPNSLARYIADWQLPSPQPNLYYLRVTSSANPAPNLVIDITGGSAVSGATLFDNTASGSRRRPGVSPAWGATCTKSARSRILPLR